MRQDCARDLKLAICKLDLCWHAPSMWLGSVLLVLHWPGAECGQIRRRQPRAHAVDVGAGQQHADFPLSPPCRPLSPDMLGPLLARQRTVKQCTEKDILHLVKFHFSNP